MPTGNYYLLYLNHIRGKSTFIILDYLTNSTSSWDPDLIDLKFIPYVNSLPSLPEITIMYNKDNYRLTIVPLTSPHSALTDYPELFI